MANVELHIGCRTCSRRHVSHQTASIEASVGENTDFVRIQRLVGGIELAGNHHDGVRAVTDQLALRCAAIPLCRTGDVDGERLAVRARDHKRISRRAGRRGSHRSNELVDVRAIVSTSHCLHIKRRIDRSSNAATAGLD